MRRSTRWDDASDHGEGDAKSEDDEGANPRKVGDHAKVELHTNCEVHDEFEEISEG